jgi:hypothetical protein
VEGHASDMEKRYGCGGKSGRIRRACIYLCHELPHRRAKDREFLPIWAFASKRGHSRWFTQTVLQTSFRRFIETILAPLTIFLEVYIFLMISIKLAGSVVEFELLMFACWFVFLIVVYSLIAYSTRLASRFSYMTNAPLRKAISEFDTNGIHGSTTAIYCTMTTSSSYYNPFVSEFVSSQLTEQLIPVYVQLNLLKTKNEITDILIQTAALPEIFPTTKLFGIKYVVDGGLTDNTPIFPVLSHSPSVVISVYLKPKFARGSQLIPGESMTSLND